MSFPLPTRYVKVFKGYIYISGDNFATNNYSTESARNYADVRPDAVNPNAVAFIRTKNINDGPDQAQSVPVLFDHIVEVDGTPTTFTSVQDAIASVSAVFFLDSSSGLIPPNTTVGSFLVGTGGTWVEETTLIYSYSGGDTYLSGTNKFYLRSGAGAQGPALGLLGTNEIILYYGTGTPAGVVNIGSTTDASSEIKFLMSTGASIISSPDILEFKAPTSFDYVTGGNNTTVALLNIGGGISNVNQALLSFSGVAYTGAPMPITMYSDGSVINGFDVSNNIRQMMMPVIGAAGTTISSDGSTWNENTRIVDEGNYPNMKFGSFTDFNTANAVGWTSDNAGTNPFFSAHFDGSNFYAGFQDLTNSIEHYLTTDGTNGISMSSTISAASYGFTADASGVVAKMTGQDGLGNDFTLAITDAGINIGLTGATEKIGFYGTLPVIQGSALTTTLTTLTQAGAFTPDYAIQALINTNAWGFATQDEAETVLSVIINMQTRIDELESRLNTSTGVGLIA